MANSPLVSFTKLSPNHSGKRTHTIDRITPHAVVGQLSVERICDCFKDRSRQASCNYAIGADGRIGLCVDEQNRSWCSSSRDNDQRAITIECASDLTEPYAMKPEVYSALVNLCADICRRNGKRKLVWIADREKALSYEVKPDEMLLTVHRWFARKSCPGNWLFERMYSFADLTFLFDIPMNSAYIKQAPGIRSHRRFHKDLPNVFVLIPVTTKHTTLTIRHITDAVKEASPDTPPGLPTA